MTCVFMNGKHKDSEMLSMLLIIIQLISGEIRIWMNQDLDPLIQAFLVPKCMLITVTLKNGTNLILYSKQPKEIIFQNVSCPFNANASPFEQLPEHRQNQTMKCILPPARRVRMKRWRWGCKSPPWLGQPNSQMVFIDWLSDTVK